HPAGRPGSPAERRNHRSDRHDLVLSLGRHPARGRADDGLVAVLVAVVIVAVVIPLLAIVVDLGLARALSRQSRGASDAAALAAAAAIRSGADQAAAVAAAQGLVQANLPAPAGGWGSAWGTCVDTDPLPSPAFSGGCISFDWNRKRVRVTVPQRPVPSAFAGAFGATSPAASATSTASWGLDSSSYDCVLCVVDGYAGGRRRVTVDGGNIAVGGDLSFAGGGGALTATSGTIAYRGTYSPGGGGVVPAPPTPAPGLQVPDPTDPLAAEAATHAAAVPYDQPSTALSGTNLACQPGTYQDIAPCASLAPGVYYITGNPGRNGRATLQGDASAGVLLYFTCYQSVLGQILVARCTDPGSSMPSLRMNGSRTLTGPGATPGLALVFDTGLTRTQRINLTGRLDVNGDIYAPDTPFGTSFSGVTLVHNGRVIIGATVFSQSLFGSGTTVLRVTGPPPSGEVPDGPIRLVPSG
ncbi:MAG: TadG family pilus assembly protein, partial [Kineosporiaceae bacterium]